MSIVSIVSGGWSASQVDLTQVPGVVIGVNNAALHAPRLDIATSMDRRWAEAHWPWVKERGDAGNIKAWLRDSSARNIPERPEWLTVYRCDYKSPKMASEPGVLNGTNSGGCALNLAYHLKPKTVYLFGFDYRRGPKGEWHWFDPKATSEVVGAAPIHETRYSGWAREFEIAARQFKAAGIEVLNVSDTSVVAAFCKISPKAFNKVAA